jgi:hypothetical protein
MTPRSAMELEKLGLSEYAQPLCENVRPLLLTFKYVLFFNQSRFLFLCLADIGAKAAGAQQLRAA